MSPSRQLCVASLMLAISPLLPACGNSSVPPPLIQNQTIRVLPPAGLIADIPPPEVPAQVGSRDEANAVMLSLAGWGAQLRQRLADLREWAAKSTDPSP
jgi:hypothetical protein